MPCLSGTAATDSEKVGPKDFAHANELKTTLEGALYRLPIQRPVYEGLVRSQNRDLAVFNADGEVVPFIVRPLSPVRDASASNLSVPLFELPPGPEGREGDFADIYVRTGATGNVVEVRGRSEAAPRGASSRRYLLDFSSLSEATGNTDSHRLQLSVAGGGDLKAGVTVFRGTNLRDWTSILKDAPLVRLRNGDARLENTGIDLPNAPDRYLLLKIDGVDTAFELREVHYSCVSRSTLIQEERAVFEGKVADDGKSAEYVLPGAFPVSKVNFVLRNPGLYRVRIGSRPDVNAPWRPAGTMELSMIRESASPVRTNASVAVDMREDRYWRVDFDRTFSGPPPKIAIFWRASEVCFLAQGRAPYILAFGSSRENLNLQNASLTGNGQFAPAAESELGASVSLAAVFSVPEAELEGHSGGAWQRYVVWGLLLLGALLLSGMAWKLLKKA
ncbi:MAG: DUF3999 domain-containing protein [Synergistaceae bacterium]|jgi:hypothetical protein|nr:DUF3999 domain-containing protein [Synergistaceae bacterium]